MAESQIVEPQFKSRTHNRGKQNIRLLKRMVEIQASSSDIPLQDEDWSERWCTLPQDCLDCFEHIFNFPVRFDDVFIVSSAGSGTTWAEDIIWLTLNRLDIQRAQRQDISQRTDFLEFSAVYQNFPLSSFYYLSQLPNPRIIKTQLPANLMPRQIWEKRQKVVYVARNVKDIVISSYYFVTGLNVWNGSLNDYAADFMNNETMYTPYWAHVIDFYKMRHEPFVFFVTYEEMELDLASVIQRQHIFLRSYELDDMQLEVMVNYLSKAKRKDTLHNLTQRVTESSNNPCACNGFMAPNGQVIGSTRDELNAEMQHKLDAWSAEMLKKHGLKEDDIFGCT